MISRTGNKVTTQRLEASHRHCEEAAVGVYADEAIPKVASEAKQFKTRLLLPPGGNRGRDRNDKSASLFGSSGFTLLEVLMAVSILAVGTVSVLRAYSTSVSAVERAQYNIDAACLLKAVMGSVEEKAVTQKGTAQGESSGELTSSSDIKMDTAQSGKWQWSVEIRDSGLRAEEPEKEAASAEGLSEEEEEPAYTLNEVKLTVVNYERTPSNKVSAVTYMEAVSAGS